MRWASWVSCSTQPRRTCKTAVREQRDPLASDSSDSVLVGLGLPQNTTTKSSTPQPTTALLQQPSSTVGTVNMTPFSNTIEGETPFAQTHSRTNSDHRFRASFDAGAQLRSSDAVQVLKSGSPSSSFFLVNPPHAMDAKLQSSPDKTNDLASTKSASTTVDSSIGSTLTPLQPSYAPKHRNKEWHDLFPNIDYDELLVDEWSCAWQREVLIQGRMYLSSRHICFNANIFGWSHSVTLDFDDIISIEKRSIGGLIPNSIEIVTMVGQKHYFASFIQRDNTYDAITRYWGNTSKAIRMKTFSKRASGAVLADSNEEEDDDLESVESDPAVLTSGKGTLNSGSSAKSDTKSGENGANLVAGGASIAAGGEGKHRNSIDAIGTWSMSMMRGGTTTETTPTPKPSVDAYSSSSLPPPPSPKPLAQPQLQQLALHPLQTPPNALSPTVDLPPALSPSLSIATTLNEPAYVAHTSSYDRRQSRGLADLPTLMGSASISSIATSMDGNNVLSASVPASPTSNPIDERRNSLVVHQRHPVVLSSQTVLEPISPPAAMQPPPELDAASVTILGPPADFESPPDSPVIDLTPHLAAIARRKAAVVSRPLTAGASSRGASEEFLASHMGNGLGNRVTVITGENEISAQSTASPSLPNLSPGSPSPEAQSKRWTSYAIDNECSLLRECGARTSYI
ncbi:hypothetical protein BC830DRAFT_583724 [Chytriomyces sp. MP71]|nr:hypothetical protein BC830DRAFT_583724 [Chytriomyces sp. MP71]